MKKKNLNNEINVPNTISGLKLKLMLVLFLLVIIALISRLIFLQFINSEELQVEATKQQTLTETISAKRGTIYDSKGKALAMSYDTDKIYIYPKEIENINKPTIAQNLADILGLNYDEVYNKLNSSSNRVLIAEDVEQNKTDTIKTWKKDLDFKTGILIEESTTRYYPSGSLASTVLGFVGSDNQGSYGIERSMNAYLSGTDGKTVTLKDASQSEIANSEKTYIAAENGYDVTLTIDSYIQDVVEKQLAAAVEEYDCDSGITIAMEPSTGRILAMADYPSYDCNSPSSPNETLLEIWDSLSSEKKMNERFEMWRPKAITDTYEPGSVFKVITSAIALEENITDTNIKNDFYCSGSTLLEGAEKAIKCHTYPKQHKYQTLTEALEHSCNPAFIDLGLRIGSETSYKYYEALGFFNKTGISIPGEPKSGIFYDLDEIKPIELAVMSFGQRFNITPIQMISAISAIANDGVYIQPKIVDKITNTDTGEETIFKSEEIRQVFSKETADKVASMLESVVVNGTGFRAQVSGYSIGGKTGTSEPVYSSSNNEGYVASFVAMSPIENTKIVLLVILKNPGEGVDHNGGVIAAPTAQKMLSEILPYMGVESGNKEIVNDNVLPTEELY